MADKKTLQELMKEINKSYGEQIISLGAELPEVKRIPFSSPRANGTGFATSQSAGSYLDGSKKSANG